jgi:RNA polymerase sigma-70 factor (ECF subfamily)
MHTTPVSLLERLRRPEEQQAWGDFVELYTPLLYHWARRAGLQSQDASDLVQDVLLLLLRKLPQFSYDHHKSFRSWLRTVTLNRWRESLRKQHLPAESDGVNLDELPGDDPAAEVWEAEYRTSLTRRALELMQADFQPSTWKACWEYVVEGRPAAEVAAELGISVGAVHTARLRVLTRLREELKGLFD